MLAQESDRSIAIHCDAERTRYGAGRKCPIASSERTIARDVVSACILRSSELMSSIETPSRVRLRSAEIGEPIPRIHGGRVLLINAAPSQDRLQAQLHSLGYNVVGRSADPWEGLSLVGSLRPDAILIVADSFDVRTAVLLARRIREHHRMAVLLLCADPNPRSLAQLKT